MSYQFSLAHLTVLHAPPPEMVEIAARAGYDFVSLRLIPLRTPGEPQYSPDDAAMIADTRRALKATGVGVLDIELACITRDREPKSYERAFEVGAELGARHVISSAWTKETNDRAFLIDRFSELCDRAQAFGLTVNLEFPCFSRLKDLSQVVDVVRAADRPNGGVLIDSLYFHFTQATLAELRALPPEWINFLHIADARRAVPHSDDGMREIAREERLYMGEGGVDFPTLLGALPVVPLSLELPNAQRVRELGYEGHARLCLQTARNYIANHLPEDVARATGTHG